MDMCKSDHQSQERQITVDGPESGRQPRVEPVAARMSGDSEDILADQPSRKRHEGCTAAESSRGIPHRTKEVQVQSAPYRLRVVPIIWRKPLKDSWSVILLRVAFSQVGLALMLLSWTMCFAVAFHFSEGPNEQLVIENFQKTENDLAIDLSTQLRQIGSEFDRSSSFPVLIHRQLRRHTAELLAAFERGYGGTGGGRIWNYAGCVLFAVSLLTTLGFGAPVPHTNCGRTAAAIFATIGVPLHFLLMFNIAQAILSKLHPISSGENIPEGPGDFNRKTGSVSKPLDKSGTNVITVTSGIEELSEHQKKRNSCFGCNWGGVLVMAFAYYILGILIFGVARGKYYQDALLFPLEFINNGALAQVGESMRLLYALYLEGLILHAALFFAVIRRSAGGSLETMFFRNNLLTNT